MRFLALLFLCVVLHVSFFAKAAQAEPLCYNVPEKWNTYIIHAIIEGDKTSEDYVQMIFTKERCDVLRALIGTFSHDDIPHAIHVALGESGLRPSTEVKSKYERSCGPMQINILPRGHAETLKEIDTNRTLDQWCTALKRDHNLSMEIALIIKEKFKRGWKQWSAHTRDKYITYDEYLLQTLNPSLASQ